MKSSTWEAIPKESRDVIVAVFKMAQIYFEREYVISDDDVKSGRKQPDAVCRVQFGVDIHEPEKPEQNCWQHPGFDIPYRSLVPLKVENLLTAGRCISGSFAAHAAYRVTGDCLAMGEAAGRAAARAVRRKCSVRSLIG